MEGQGVPDPLVVQGSTVIATNYKEWTELLQIMVEALILMSLSVTVAFSLERIKWFISYQTVPLPGDDFSPPGCDVDLMRI